MRVRSFQLSKRDAAWYSVAGLPSRLPRSYLASVLSLTLPGRENSCAHVPHSIGLVSNILPGGRPRLRPSTARSACQIRRPARPITSRLAGISGTRRPDLITRARRWASSDRQIDFVTDLGIEQTKFRQLKVVLRPAQKHKFRFEYTPITYEAVGTLKANIIFNGILTR